VSPSAQGRISSIALFSGQLARAACPGPAASRSSRSRLIPRHWELRVLTARWSWLERRPQRSTSQASERACRYRAHLSSRCEVRNTTRPLVRHPPRHLAARPRPSRGSATSLLPAISTVSHREPLIELPGDHRRHLPLNGRNDPQHRLRDGARDDGVDRLRSWHLFSLALSAPPGLPDYRPRYRRGRGGTFVALFSSRSKGLTPSALARTSSVSSGGVRSPRSSIEM